jgi:hypothetical protein
MQDDLNQRGLDMKKILLVLLFLVLPSIIFAGEVPLSPYGELWQQMTESEKRSFIEGYVLRSKETQNFLEPFLYNLLDDLDQIRNFEDVEEVRVNLARLSFYLIYIKVALPDGSNALTMEQIQEGIDNFYKDYRNTDVIFGSDILKIIKMEIEGEKKEKVECEIEALRFYWVTKDKEKYNERHNECYEIK